MGSQWLRSLMLLPLNRTFEPVKSMDWSQVPVKRIRAGGGHFHSKVIDMLAILFRVYNSDFWYFQSLLEYFVHK